MDCYNNYKFQVVSVSHVWVYVIFCPKYSELAVLKISDECYETEQEARFAAIGHICLLEKGEVSHD